MCHEKSIIDFSKFTSALIVGKISGNDLYSNGVGKTTIFKAIEYALFNASDVNLDKLVRDDCKFCKVIFDFEIDSEIYRVSRSRSKKGTSDLSLFKKIITDSGHTENADDKIWKDISGRRAPDTEKDLISLIKINPKSFRSTVHFAQNDFSGITTATPEKRKAMLKENLSLAFYSKMEKMAKDKFNDFCKKIEKNQTIIDSITASQEDVKDFEDKISQQNTELKKLVSITQSLKLEIKSKDKEKSKISTSIENIINENKSISSRLDAEKVELGKLNSKSKDLLDKKSAILAEAKSLASELNKIKDEKVSLEVIDYSQIDALQKKIDNLESSSNESKIYLEKNKDKIKQLKVPLPEGTECDYCRQSLSQEHIEECKKSINDSIIELEEASSKANKELLFLQKEIADCKGNVKSLQQSKSRLDSVSNQFLLKEEQIKDKKKYYTEYSKMIDEFQSQISSKEELLKDLEKQIEQSSSKKTKKLSDSLLSISEEIDNLSKRELEDSNKISELNNSIAVLKHSLNVCGELLVRKKELAKEIKDLEGKAKIYPKVIESFSSSGIPNLIIQNLLDELQSEANILLGNLKPGLQLQFLTEKEKKDGSSNDTLDILYFVQGKNREYEQLSGAMKLAVNFSLKLGMSFLLQKMFDTKINLLLLDEIDQALDKAGVDAFADIIKFFQNDFTIMVITHNDRIKDKFKDIILVEQDKDMVSNAKVLTW
jgi:DNA repair exonuclease SbcCD ATPase subunit